MASKSIVIGLALWGIALVTVGALRSPDNTRAQEPGPTPSTATRSSSADWYTMIPEELPAGYSGTPLQRLRADYWTRRFWRTSAPEGPIWVESIGWAPPSIPMLSGELTVTGPTFNARLGAPLHLSATHQADVPDVGEQAKLLRFRYRVTDASVAPNTLLFPGTRDWPAGLELPQEGDWGAVQFLRDRVVYMVLVASDDDRAAEWAIRYARSLDARLVEAQAVGPLGGEVR